MPANIPIEGDDVQWKRKADQEIAALKQAIFVLQQQVKYLQSRTK